MLDEHSITHWIAALRAGDSEAAGRLWERYYARLVRYAANRLRAAPRRMADEEDAVLTAFDSFCRGVQAGRFPRLDDRDDLWQVLIMLTARKAINQCKHDVREKRGGGAVRGDSAFLRDGEPLGFDQFVGREPSPEFTAEFVDECRSRLDQLGDDTLTQVALLKLEGYQNAEIADRLCVKIRTIERKLNLIRELWSNDPTAEE